MKTAIRIIVLSCAISMGLAEATPRGTYSAGEYAEAKAKAVETGKPIAIVTTELKSRCPKCLTGNEEVFKHMRRDYVLVIDDKTSGKSLPEAVKQQTYPIYKSKGNIIPIVAVLSQTDEKLLGGLCYRQISADGRKAFTTLDKEVAEALAKVSAPPGQGDKSPSGGMREWKNAEGRSITAEAVRRSETTVTFRMENGSVVEYALDKLSEESRKQVTESLDSM